MSQPWDIQLPMFKDDWDQNFSEKYGYGNVTWIQVKLTNSYSKEHQVVFLGIVNILLII